VCCLRRDGLYEAYRQSPLPRRIFASSNCQIGAPDRHVAHRVPNLAAAHRALTTPHRLSIAARRLSVATPRLAIAARRLSVATHRLSIASARLSIAAPCLST
jgi:hypothetical protein